MFLSPSVSFCTMWQTMNDIKCGKPTQTTLLDSRILFTISKIEYEFYTNVAIYTEYGNTFAFISNWNCWSISTTLMPIEMDKKWWWWVNGGICEGAQEVWEIEVEANEIRGHWFTFFWFLFSFGHILLMVGLVDGFYHFSWHSMGKNCVRETTATSNIKCMHTTFNTLTEMQNESD